MLDLYAKHDSLVEKMESLRNETKLNFHDYFTNSTHFLMITKKLDSQLQILQMKINDLQMSYKNEDFVKRFLKNFGYKKDASNFYRVIMIF